MINRRNFTPDGDDPPMPVPISPYCTIPTEQMAYLLADLLDCEGCDVLEIGTGSGYETAILAERCRSVTSIDIELHPVATEQLRNCNVLLIKANGCLFSTGAKFERILVTFGARLIAQVWMDQLADGGKLVIPIRNGESCQICVYEKTGGVLELIDAPAYAPFTRGAEA